MELSLEAFHPKKAELVELATEAQAIDLPDPFDQAQRAKAEDVKKRLVKKRNEVKNAGLEMRDEANKFRNDVFAIEKEYLAIIAPEEERIKSLLDAAEKAIERKARVELLPARQARLVAIDGIEAPDDQLLDMDGPAFEGYCNMRLAQKNEADRKALAAAQKKLDDEKAELQRQKDIADAEERGRKEAAEKAERDRKEAEEKAKQPPKVVAAPEPKQTTKPEAKPTTIELPLDSLYAFKELVETAYLEYINSLEEDEKASAFGFHQRLVRLLEDRIVKLEIPF